MRGTTIRRAAAASVAIATAAIALTACSGTAATPASQPTLSTDDVTIRFGYWGSDSRAAITDAAIAAFEKENPNITVEGEFKDWTGYWDQLATQTAASDAPDVIGMDEIYLSSYGNRGALLDLANVSDILTTDKFDGTALGTGQIDGTQYALPTGTTVYSVVVNLDLLKKYGIEEPDGKTWTWDDYASIAKQVSDASGGDVRGTQAWGFDAGGLKIWARQHGEELYGADGSVAISKETLADYWTYLKDLTDSGSAPSASETTEYQNAGIDAGCFATQKCAFATYYNTQLTALLTDTGANLALLPVPGEAASSSPGLFSKASQYLSIGAKSKHPAEAAAFVNFLLNNTAAAPILGTDRGISANADMRTAISSTLTDADKLALAYEDNTPVGKAPVLTPTGASSVETILGRYTQAVLAGEQTPADAAQAFITELQGEIDAAG